MLGPTEASGKPTELTVPCRRYVCVACSAVMLVVPRAMLPRRRYSASAIALALALYGIERAPPAQVRRRTSPFGKVGYRACTGWVTLGRWADAVRARRLFAQVRPCPARFTRRQVAERAATTLGSRAPPPMDAPLTVRPQAASAAASRPPAPISDPTIRDRSRVRPNAGIPGRTAGWTSGRRNRP
jgi:hypothetical protein